MYPVGVLVKLPQEQKRRPCTWIDKLFLELNHPGRKGHREYICRDYCRHPLTSIDLYNIHSENKKIGAKSRPTDSDYF